MEYPLISEYKEAILSAEDNFNELSSLRPVLDDYGNPVMSSGNFAVVFKMKDEEDGKLYAVKCFIKDQEGRDESYRKIADELEMVSSSYILPVRYLEKELFVDTDHCSEEEFPVVVMEWVDGKTLYAYLNRNLNRIFELKMLSYRFNRMAAWLLAQPFAHGDLKPDNILVRKDGSLVLVDYDGMFVPAMKGEKAREIGSPDYRHPARTDADFDEHIDDFSIAVIALSLKAIAINPSLKSSLNSSDTLLIGERDFQDSANSTILKEIIASSSDAELSRLLSSFFLALANNSLDMMSFRLFMTNKPIRDKSKKRKTILTDETAYIDTSVTDKDLEGGVEDGFGGIYSRDGKFLLKYRYPGAPLYIIKKGTKVICDNAFQGCEDLKSIIIPDSLTHIGKGAFVSCINLQYITLPNFLIHIGSKAFWDCSSLEDLTIPKSVKAIGENPFCYCHKLQVHSDNNDTYNIIDGMLIDSEGNLISCLNYSSDITIPPVVVHIGNHAFRWNYSIKNISIPDSVRSIGISAFRDCKLLRPTIIPRNLVDIKEYAFWKCQSLSKIYIPNTLTQIGECAFPTGCRIIKRKVKS